MDTTKAPSAAGQMEILPETDTPRRSEARDGRDGRPDGVRVSKRKARPPPAFVITLIDIGDIATSDSRLKRWLKSALRTYDLRCTCIRPANEKETDVKRDDAFPSRYFKAKDLTQPRTLTVDTVEFETMEGEEKPVLVFSDDKKRCVLNQSRWEAMEEATGSDDTENWGGRTVTLFQGKTRFQGKQVPCVCIRAAEDEPWHGAAATS